VPGSEQRWQKTSRLSAASRGFPQIIESRLAQQLHVKNLRPNPMRSFSELSEHIVLRNEVRRRRLNSRQISIHADILKERHDKGALSTSVSWEEFKDADLFLFLKSLGGSNQGTGQYWWPQTAVYLGSHVPRYLTDSTTLPGAKQLAALLGVKDSELRTHVNEALTFLRDGLRQMGSYHFLFGGFDRTGLPRRRRDCRGSAKQWKSLCFRWDEGEIN
jgi:hypothetical protein